MTRHTFLTVLIFSLAALALALSFSPGREQGPSRLPWQIAVQADGSSEVFGIHFGRTTLGQAERIVGAEAEISLFESRDGTRVVEAYFDKVTLSGLSAKIVMGFDLDAAELAAMYQRGLRISTLGSGTRKVSLHHDDLLRLRLTPVGSLTYLPSINLSEAQVTHRFGEPGQRIDEPGEPPLSHLLYPDLGLDITLSEKGKDLLQYVAPRDFNRLSAPLAR